MLADVCAGLVQGENKNFYIHQLRAHGFNFSVHGRAFIVHRVHPPSNARQNWYARGTAARLNSSLTSCDHRRNTKAINTGRMQHYAGQLRAGVYRAHVAPVFGSCVAEFNQGS